MFSTHDWTVSAGEVQLNETWADVKAPGGFPTTMVPGVPATVDNRVTYAVGTVQVQTTAPGSLFSGQSANPAVGVPPFVLAVPATRQVAIVQTNSGDTLSGSSTVGDQWFFYGTTGGAPQRSTNARAISVWEDGLPANRRIAICGETYDQELLLSQAPAGGWPNATAQSPSGFIAVFDGVGTLRWSHHFFAGADPAAACAVTDLSVRVDGEGNDVVTYCGIFSHGDPGIGSELTPLAAFAQAGACSGGDTLQAPGQWDGFVGRVVAPLAGGAAQRQFHSIVGGPGQDGLFGLAEIDENRFAVVGSAVAGAGQAGFPFTAECGLVGPYVVGTALIFDATPVVGGNDLLLERSVRIGSAVEGVHTMARDVVLGRSAFPTVPSEDLLYVVGSTDDVALAGTFTVPAPGGQDVLNGPTDGFVAALRVDGTVPSLERWTMSYHGGEGNDGLTGIQAWSEYPEHVTVTGFSDVNGSVDIDVASYFFNNAIGPATPGHTGPPNASLQMLRIRQTQVGGLGEDRPAVMGADNATTVGLPFVTFGLGQPAGESGGGVAVGENGRCCVVGRTNPAGGAGYPVVGVGARGPDLAADAVRTELDLLPTGIGGLQGAGRTDGTGFQAPVPVFPPAVASGLTGGTTPFCALAEFGDRIGQPTPPNGLRRMLIDFEGDMQAGSTNAAILVSQPNPIGGSIVVGVLEFGFPPAAPWAYLNGTEFWLGGGVYSTFPAVSGSPIAFRLPLAPLTMGSGPISAQMTCFLGSNVQGPAPGCSSPYSASPAMWFNF